MAAVDTVIFQYNDFKLTNLEVNLKLKLNLFIAFWFTDESSLLNLFLLRILVSQYLSSYQTNNVKREWDWTCEFCCPNQMLTEKMLSFHCFLLYMIFFSLWVFFYVDIDDSRVSGKGRTNLYSYLSLPLALKHSDIYLEVYNWDDYHVFLMAAHVITRLLLNEIQQTLGISILI